MRSQPTGAGLPFSLFVLAILTAALIPVNSPFGQMDKEQVHSFPGVIESMPAGSQFIVVNEMRIFVLPITRILDEKGTLLTVSDLKSRLRVSIDAVQNKEGFFAKKIVITRPEKSP